MVCTQTFTASYPYSHDLPYKLNTFDLQLFSQEKTEDATPKRKQEARKKGQVAKSIEINTAFIILAGFFSLKLFGQYFYTELIGLMHFIFSHFSTDDFTITSVHILLINISLIFLKVVLPFMGIILVISLFINFMQVGFTLSFEPLMPKLERINPLEGAKRFFSKRSIVELFKSLFKVCIIGYFIYRFIKREITFCPSLINSDLNSSFQWLGLTLVDLALQIGGVILVLASFDYFYQWWEHNQSLKMSKQEVKEEYKQTEGNPQIKGKIKERQRAIAMRRMMQQVPTADVVITNPTHYAVALKYEKKMVAPVVIAKGQDFLAGRIKEIAKENRVAIVENKPLARTLYAITEVGDMVPPELYQAVAEVLAHVYRLKKRLS